MGGKEGRHAYITYLARGGVAQGGEKDDVSLVESLDDVVGLDLADFAGVPGESGWVGGWRRTRRLE